MSRSISENAETTYLYSCPSSSTARVEVSQTFRNITSESTNQKYQDPLSYEQRQYAGDEKLVSRLYRTIEIQENEIEGLNKKFHTEERRREESDRELAELKEQLADTKKRFANFKKQERENKHKLDLDEKQRRREEADRWNSTMTEMETVRKSLSEKADQLSEYQLLYSNLQSSLDKGESKVKNDLQGAEKRVELMSKMLDNCYSQLTKAEKQLCKEKKMKQVLIKINEALQAEIKRKGKELQECKAENGTLLVKSSSLKSKESEDNTNDIVRELRIEDALFYFDEVKKQYMNRPKVYREFLDTLRLYKNQSLSTPEVIARISKLFHGKSKLIIGFNRFLPKDYHLSIEDIADFTNAMPQPSDCTDKKGKERKLPQQKCIENESIQKKKKTKNNNNNVRDKGNQWNKVEEDISSGRSKKGSIKKKHKEQDRVKTKMQERNKSVTGETKRRGVLEKKCNHNRAQHLRAMPTASRSYQGSDCDSVGSGDDDYSSQGVLEKNCNHNSAQRFRAMPTASRSYEGSDCDSVGSEDADYSIQDSSLDAVAEGLAMSRSLTINTSAPSFNEPEVPQPIPGGVGKGHGNGKRTDTRNGKKAITSQKKHVGLVVKAPSNMTEASEILERFKSFNLSSVASSVFGGIESDSLAVNTLSTFDYPTLYMPSDRYDIIEDQDYNAIEVLAQSAGIEMLPSLREEGSL